MRASGWIPGLVLAVLAAAGCSSTPETRSVDAFDDELRAASDAQKEPLVFTIAVVPPIVVGPVGAASEDGAAGTTETAMVASPAAAGQEKYVGPRPVDRAALAARLVEDVKRLKLFRRVDGLAPQDLPVELAAQRRAVASAAREIRADLVLVPRVKVHEVAYAGVTGWWVPSMLCCVTLWFPTFWFPDEEWAASATLEAELLSARTGKVIWGPSEFPARSEGTFDDFDRGWDLLGPWGIPLFTTNGVLGVQESNLQAVEARLMPDAMASSERALLKGFSSYLRRVPIKLEATEPQTFALVVGIDRHGDPNIPSLECAESDAQAIAKLLREPSGGGLSDRNLKLLVGRDATRGQILEFLNVELAKTAPADRVIIFFAGYGAVAPDASLPSEAPRDTGEPGKERSYGYKKYLVTADTDAKKLEDTAIAVDDLAAALDRTAADKVIVILDTSFGGDIPGRTLPLARAAPGDTINDRFLERVVARPGRFVLTAAEVAGTAQEYIPERHGVFTMLLEQGLREIGADKQGSRVTLLDVVEYLRERVPPSSSLIGERQDVRLFGDRAAAATVVLVDRSVKLANAPRDGAPRDDQRPK